ncbi:MAG: adenylate/guanylate cyclase domain-containing protein [Betaproteobacteria bacterium]
MPPAVSFEDHLAREIVASERLRMGALAALLALLLAVLAVLYGVYQEDYRRHFATSSGSVRAIAVLGLLLAYELAVRQVVGRRAAAGKSIPESLRYLNALVETSVPSLLIILIARETNPVVVLQGAAVLIYGVFIVLSTMRLDFRLSAFTGAVAAIEYVTLCWHYAGSGGAALAGTPLASPPFYLAKGAMLLLAGLAAGFVAHQLKRRVGNAFRAQEERERILGTFGQQVSPEIVEALLQGGSGPESRRAFVCVMFMDIRGFTPMVENKSPEDIVAIQNAVFGAAIEVVNRHRGVINQFLGDGFMASFGAPLATGVECRDAVAAARELVARIEMLAVGGTIPPTRIGVGLHCGEAVTGNVGSAARKQYSITGNVVILAARIEQLTKDHGAQILASGEVLAAAGEMGATAIGPVAVKGRHEPIELFRLA